MNKNLTPDDELVKVGGALCALLDMAEHTYRLKFDKVTLRRLDKKFEQATSLKEVEAVLIETMQLLVKDRM
jgi:hypothetical protein